MSDEGMSGVWGDEVMEAAEGKIALERNLAPAGWWEGALVKNDAGEGATRKVVATNGGNHPMEGKTVYGCHLLLSTDEGPKHLFFDACPETIKVQNEDGGSYIRQESTNAAMLYRATRLFGVPFVKVLEKATSPMKYKIRTKKATEQYEAKSVIDNIKAIDAA